MDEALDMLLMFSARFPLHDSI